jgi:excisionase family DNA binding protein
MLTLEKPTRIIPSADDRATARRLAEEIRNVRTLHDVSPELAATPISEYIRDILSSILDRASETDNFYLLNEEGEVSPNQAAKIIGASRPFVVYLIEEKILPAYKVGSHYRIKTKAVKDYMEAREQRYQHVAELVEDREELGL